MAFVLSLPPLGTWEAARAHGYIDGIKGADDRGAILPPELAQFYAMGRRDGDAVRQAFTPTCKLVDALRDIRRAAIQHGGDLNNIPIDSLLHLIDSALGEAAPMIAAAAGFSVIPMRDLNKGKPASEGTQFEECDAGSAELWSVFFTPEGGESNLIDDCPTESAARALVERMQELETLDDGTPMRWQNTYECECGNTWTDTWDSCCDDECAACGKDISPSESVDLASA